MSVGTIGNVRFPRLEKGGILKKGQIGLLEGKGTEAVVPLEKNKYWIQEVTNELKKQLIGEMSQGMYGASNLGANNYNNNFTQIINAPKQPSRLELYRQTKNLLNLVKA